MSSSGCKHGTRTKDPDGKEVVESWWGANVVSLGKYKKRSPTRSGFSCMKCKLVALPPKAGKRAKGWNPPVGS
jgi:hypothetical protein